MNEIRDKIFRIISSCGSLPQKRSMTWLEYCGVWKIVDIAERRRVATSLWKQLPVRVADVAFKRFFSEIEWNTVMKEDRVVHNPIEDIAVMHKHYGFSSKEMTVERLAFRQSLLQEEFEESMTALADSNAEEYVDALVDIVVIALGTLDLCGVDSNQAWREVLIANMSKERGTKEGRVSDGWDLRKPSGWVAPDHSGNSGIINSLLKGE